MSVESNLEVILSQYCDSFREKVYSSENEDHDLLMDAFGVTPELKRENRQYWGRELGMCWQLLVVEVCKATRKDFQPALKIGSDEPCDLIVSTYAIDTKYRIGSGDSGTLKKFKSYGPLLRAQGYEPVFLILREDNLRAAISACEAGKWNIFIGNHSFDFIKDITGFDMKEFLSRKAKEFHVHR